MRRLAWFVCVALSLAATACGDVGFERRLQILLPANRDLLRAIVRLELRAERDGRVIAQRGFPGDATTVSVSGVSHGPTTVFALEGLTALGDVAGRGRTCPVDFAGTGPEVPLYFAPVNFFAPTRTPIAARDRPSALQLANGQILLFGGSSAGTPLGSAERFTPGLNEFAAAADSALGTPRIGARVSEIVDVGALVSGGVDGQGAAIGGAEIWSTALGSFQPLANARLVPRVDHASVAIPDGRVLLAGGRTGLDGAVLSSTTMVRLLNDGTALVSDGPTLGVPRRNLAAVVAPGSVVLFGGYSDAATPLDTIEIVELAGGVTVTPTLTTIPQKLNAPRAEATATLLEDGTVLIVGGKDATSTRNDAELWNPVTRKSESLPLANARSAHQATLLPGGRVLITGGLDGTGAPLSTVELYIPGVGFVTERPLGSPRAGHVAITLCDQTVLVVGGGEGAEIYTPPAG